MIVTMIDTVPGMTNGWLSGNLPARVDPVSSISIAATVVAGSAPGEVVLVGGIAELVPGLLEPGGRVIGKRCGTSQNIGAKARKAKD